jgi:HTH-type transcriptional regulator/antitoxin HigA
MENIRALKTQADYDWAIAEITRYFEDEPKARTPEGDRFDVLATLIESYEDKHYPIEALDPVEAIRSHMTLFDLPRKALAEIIGSSPRATEILNRKRALTMDMVFKLNKEWHIPAEVLIQPYHLAKDFGGNRVR